MTRVRFVHNVYGSYPGLYAVTADLGGASRIHRVAFTVKKVGLNLLRISVVLVSLIAMSFNAQRF